MADSPRGSLLIELSSPSSSERVPLYTRGENGYRYTDIAKALRDTLGNGSQLQAHDQHLPMEMQLRTIHWSTQRPYTPVSLVKASNSAVLADWFGDCDCHSVADSWAAFGDWQESDEDETTWYDADCEKDSWNGIEEFLEELAHNVTPAVLDGQLQERDDDTDAVQSLQQVVVAANAAEDASRQTWTQARHLMNEVCRNRGYRFTNAHGPLTSEGNRKGKG